VNILQEEIPDFMKIAETLKIKGLVNDTKKRNFAENIETSMNDLNAKKVKRAHEDNDDGKNNKNKSKEYSQDHDEAQMMLTEPEISIETEHESSNKSEMNQDGRKMANVTINDPYGQFDLNDAMHLSQMKLPMDVTGSNITMISSTSLLHGNCIYNRNNTVATQQGKYFILCT
jgi:tRNA U34 5-carboxymethylaminomethyl modifying enzyme MnmG/GidA